MIIGYFRRVNQSWKSIYRVGCPTSGNLPTIAPTYLWLNPYLSETPPFRAESITIRQATYPDVSGWKLELVKLPSLKAGVSLSTLLKETFEAGLRLGFSDRLATFLINLNQVRYYPKSIASGIIQIAPKKNPGLNLYKLSSEEHSRKTYA